LSKIPNWDPTIISLIISIPAYIAVIVLNTILFTPVQTEPGLSRYMIPVLLILFIVLGKLLSDYARIPYVFNKVMILFVLLVGLRLYFTDTVDFIKEPPLSFRNYTDRKNECGEDLNQFISKLPQVSFLTNNCEYFYFMTGKPCQHLRLYESAYQPGGENYQSVHNGNIIAYAQGFGTEPPGIDAYLANLDDLGYACYMEFYQLPANNE
jgi:Ca2+/Na+ antiporter